MAKKYTRSRGKAITPGTAEKFFKYKEKKVRAGKT
tara:strand:- start:145 stop:249 length:105 start_codon:yes stop_codon:yes gene_type:complete